MDVMLVDSVWCVLCVVVVRTVMFVVVVVVVVVVVPHLILGTDVVRIPVP